MAKKSNSAAEARLRFPGFVGHTLQEMRLSDVTAESAIRNGDVLSATSVMGVSKVDGIVPMEERIIASDIARYKVVRKDWFAYNPMRLNIGSIARWRGEADILVSPDYVVFRCLINLAAGIEPDYLDHFRRSPLWDAFVKEGGDGGVRIRIYFKDLARFGLVLPPRAEQQKIADCLTSLDEVIAALGRKVEALKTYKRGLMQQLFPRKGETIPRLRFPEFRNSENWREAKAGTVFKNRTERGERTLPIYSVTMTDGLVNRASLDRRVDDLADARANKRAHTNDIVYDTMRMWQGACGVAEEECMLSPAYVVLVPQSGVDSAFFGYLFKLPDMLRLFTAHSRGLTEDRLRLYFDDFSNVPLVKPALREQRRIAGCLAALDTSIRIAAERLSVLKSHKHALMQQLFPSPVSAAA